MDQVMRNDARENPEWENIVVASRGGVIFVDAAGRVVGVDTTAQHRLDGELKQLELPIHRFDNDAVDCFVSARTLDIKGTPTRVCVVQEREPTGSEILLLSQVVAAREGWESSN